MSRMNVGVLMGGLSAEREISLKTGHAVLEALVERGHHCTPVFVDSNLDQVLRETPIDVAFIALHGPLGEDGTVQGLLEVLRIPYTGSSVLTSALAMDKAKAKDLFRLYNVPTPPSYSVRLDDLSRLEEIHGGFGYPAFVKPKSGGSSVGAGKADSPTELRQRVTQALEFDSTALVERYVGGVEVAVGLLDGRALGAIEITPKGNFLDYRSKYQKGESEFHFPARLSPTRYRGVLNLAERANAAVGGTSATRVDLLVTEGNNEYVLEVNTLPGMTKGSLLPQIAAGSGYDFGSLCEAILERATLHARSAAPTANKATRTAPVPMEMVCEA